MMFDVNFFFVKNKICILFEFIYTKL